MSVYSIQPRFSALVFNYVGPEAKVHQFKASLRGGDPKSDGQIRLDNGNGSSMPLATDISCIRESSTVLGRGQGIKIPDVKKCAKGFLTDQKARLLSDPVFCAMARTCHFTPDTLWNSLFAATNKIHVSRSSVSKMPKTPSIPITVQSDIKKKKPIMTPAQRGNDRQWLDHPLFGEYS